MAPTNRPACLVRRPPRWGVGAGGGRGKNRAARLSYSTLSRASAFFLVPFFSYQIVRVRFFREQIVEGALDQSKLAGLNSVVTGWGRSGRIKGSSGCWIWTGPVNGFGYALCGVQGMQTAQRVTWAWRHGRVPSGVLRNECGNRLCVRPEHWREDLRPPSRLAVRREMMRELHGAGLGIGEIAERVGCSRQAVSRFVRGLPVVGLEGMDE